MKSTFYIYSGAIHIHSTYSDGSASIETIAEIASRLKMDYIIIADHLTIESKLNGKEKKYGHTWALIGCELNDPVNENLNHYLAFNITTPIDPSLGPAEFVKAVKNQGGFGFIAHPDEIRGEAMRDFPANPWLEWQIQDFDGIEIWNQMSEWIERLKPLNKLWMVISPRKGIYAPSERTLAKWDLLNCQRKVPAIGGIDVHATPYKIGPLTLTFFPYAIQFQSIRTNVILREPLGQELSDVNRQILNAIREGHTYIYNQRWGKIEQLPFWAENPQGETVIPGESIPYNSSIILKVMLPRDAQIKLILNGVPILVKNGENFTIPITRAGNYRLEAYRHSHGWLFTNNIYITP